MIERIKHYFLKSKVGSFIFLLFLILIPFNISKYISLVNSELLNFFIIFFLILVIIEILFQLIYIKRNGHRYKTPSIIKFKNLHIEPHPYIPYIFKKNFPSPPSEPTRFSLNRGKYISSKLKTNNLRFYNGENGDRDIEIPKPKDLLRINCLGESTTQYYLNFENKNFSYPLELERILKSRIKKNLEVNNCAQGGYNTADLLIRFCLQIIDTEPDYIIIYHGQTDIRSFITPNFENDYFHSRKNLAESYKTLKRNSKIPNLPFNFLNYFKNHWFPYDTRSYLMDLIHKSNENDKIDYKPGLKIYKRNLQQIIDICLAKNIEVILGTYCHYLYDNVKNSSIHNLYNKIVDEENLIIKQLAAENNLDLVDNDKLIMREESNFMDSVHFTPKGMNLLAKNFSEKIIKKINETK